LASVGSGSDQAEGMVDVFHCGVGLCARSADPGQRLVRVRGVHVIDGDLGVAHLKNWRILTKLRLDVRHATTLLRALLVLTNIEIAR
jgi:hypothetical protein